MPNESQRNSGRRGLNRDVFSTIKQFAKRIGTAFSDNTPKGLLALMVGFFVACFSVSLALSYQAPLSNPSEIVWDSNTDFYKGELKNVAVIGSSTPSVVKLKYGTEYVRSGSLTLEYNAGQMTDWLSIDSDTNTPKNTSITLKMRSSSDGYNWSAWTPILEDVPSNRNLQIEASFTTSLPQISPTLDSIKLKRQTTTGGTLFKTPLGYRTVASPIVPGYGSYQPPIEDVMAVSNSEALATALAATTPKTIILEDGVYDQGSAFAFSGAHRLWARHPGKAVLQAGLLIYGKSAAEVHGLSFNITDPNHTINGRAIDVYDGDHQVYEDISIEGNGLLAVGLMNRAPSGATIARLRVSHVTDYGLYLGADGKNLGTIPASVQDIQVDGVSTTGSDSNPTVGTAILVGHPATVKRLQAQNFGRYGVWVGQAINNSSLEDVDLASDVPTAQGIYSGHRTSNVAVNRLIVDVPGNAIATDWRYSDPAFEDEVVGTDGLQFTDGNIISSQQTGVYVDTGTKGLSLDNVVIAGAKDNIFQGKSSETSLGKISYQTPPDGTAPTVTIASPLVKTNLTNNVALTAQAKDNFAVAAVQFQIDGRDFGPRLTRSPYSLNWDTMSVNNGAHTISANVWDRRGNGAGSAITSVTVANPPSTTFYVDSVAGSDANSGRAASAPWQSIAKLNTQSFLPGDKIYLKCGSGWQDMLTLNGQGNAANYIEVDQYGDCNDANRPALRGGGSGYAGIEVAHHQKYISYKNLTLEDWSSGYGIYIHSGSHLRFNKLLIRGNGTGIISPDTATGSSEIQISNSQIVGFSDRGVGVDIRHPKSFGWQLSNVEVSQAGEDCIFDGAGKTTYNNIKVHHCGFDLSISRSKHALYARGPDITVKNSEFYDLYDGTLGGAGGSCLSIRAGGLVENNRLHDCVLGIGWFDYTQDASQTLDIRRNVVWNNANGNLYIDYTRNQPDNPGNIPGHSVEFNITNNTFEGSVAMTTPGVDLRGPADAGLSTNIHFDNNIISGSYDGNPLLAVFKEGNAGSYKGQHNVYFNSSGTTTLRHKTSDYIPSGLPGEAGSRVANPLVASTSQPNLTSNSPAVDVGVSNPAGNQLVGGCRGILNSYCGKAPDAGALESTFTAVDSSGPSLSLDSPVKDATVSATTILRATANDPSGIAGVQFKLDGQNLGPEDTATPYEFSWDTLGVNNGNHSLTATATDKAGNITTTPATTIKINNTTPDTAAPSTPVDLAVTKATSASLSFSWTASNDDRAVANYKVYRNGNTKALATPKETNYTDKKVSVGERYSYRVTAVDAAGNESPQSTSLSTTVPDDGAPSQPTKLHTTSTSSNSVVLAWEKSSDNVGINGYKLFRNGDLIASPTTTNYTDNSVDVDNTYAYSLVAVDSAGNSSPPSESLGVWVPDTTAPTAAFTAPSLNAELSGEVTVSAKADDNIGLASLQFMVDGQNIAEQLSDSPYSAVWETWRVANGPHTLSLKAYDLSGNSVTASLKVTVKNSYDDHTAPSIPTGLQVVSSTNSSITLHWKATEDKGGAGLANYRLYRNGAPIALPKDNYYIDKGLNPGTTYTYALAAQDAANNTSGIGPTLSSSTEAANIALPGDINKDSHVDLIDLALFLSRSDNAVDQKANVNHTDGVDIIDLSILLSHWESLH